MLVQSMEKKVELATSKNKKVQRGYDKISDMNDSKDVWKLAVRIVDLWTVISKYRQESMEMIIVDKEVSCCLFYTNDIYNIRRSNVNICFFSNWMQNVKIQLTLPTEELAEHKAKLELNKTFGVQNFKVLKNDLVVKACAHPFRLMASGATIITPKDFPEIPVAKYNFKDFEEILTGNYRTDLLIGKSINFLGQSTLTACS